MKFSYMFKSIPLMTLDTYKSILAVCPILLRPIIRILLRTGINFKQFAKISREIFIDVASEDFGINGRKTNISRVSILTGISRSEVTKIRRQQEENDEAKMPSTLSNASRILSAWHQDPEYLDENGKPKELEITSNSNVSFEKLMNNYGGDIPLTAMLKELKNSHSIETTESGKLIALNRYYMPTNFDANRIYNTAEVFVDIGNTVYHNLVRGLDQKSRFEGRAFNQYIKATSLDEFNLFIEKRGQSFLEEVDAWLTEHEEESIEKDSAIPIRLGIGVYYIKN